MPGLRVRRVLFAIAVLVVELALGGTANATSVTMGFVGTIDISGMGGPSPSTLSGTITWDSSAVPIALTPDEAFYDAASTLVFDGVAYSTHNSQVGAMTLRTGDEFDFLLSPTNSLNVGSVKVDVVGGSLEFPRSSVFGFPYPLPGNLDFLDSLVGASIYAMYKHDFDDGSTSVGGPFLTVGPASIAPAPAEVPEPATLTLLGTAVIGFGAKQWRASRARTST